MVLISAPPCFCNCRNNTQCDTSNNKCNINNECNVYNDVHSEIHDFPIDYDKYPLAKDCVEQTFEVKSGEYIIIPPRWLHWVFTEENTLAVSYTIYKINFTDTSNVFYDSMSNNKPYVGKMNDKYNINYNKFLKDCIDISFECLYSVNHKCCPVYKNYDYPSFEYSDTLRNIIDISNRERLFAYIAMNNLKNNDVLNEYRDINHFFPENIQDFVDYESYTWFTLNNMVDSGLHYDSYTYNILYVLDGKKTVRLFHPDCRKNMYIKNFEYISYIQG
jgi:hypothetical protein